MVLRDRTEEREEPALNSLLAAPPAIGCSACGRSVDFRQHPANEYHCGQSARLGETKTAESGQGHWSQSAGIHRTNFKISASIRQDDCRAG